MAKAESVHQSLMWKRLAIHGSRPFLFRSMATQEKDITEPAGGIDPPAAHKPGLRRD